MTSLRLRLAATQIDLPQRGCLHGLVSHALKSIDLMSVCLGRALLIERVITDRRPVPPHRQRTQHLPAGRPPVDQPAPRRRHRRSA